MSGPRYFYGGVFVVSGTLMALQILQSRIFSVTTWYHLAFLVISVAMFGLTLAALKVHSGDEQAQRRDYAMIMARASDNLCACILIALMAQMFVPIIFASFWLTAITLPLISLFTVLPYYQAGIVLTMALTRSPFPVARTYGVDLIGAAAGCLCALVLMEVFDAPSAIMFLAIAGFVAVHFFSKAGGARLKGARAGVLACLAAAGIAANTMAPQHIIYPLSIKSEIVTQDQLALDQWNAISRVAVFNEETQSPPYLWGPSSRLPADIRHPFYWLTIDGDAGTPIYRYGGDRDDISFLEYDVTTIAYSLPGIERVGIIGVGGGRDVLSAHYFGASQIAALDINKVQISLLAEAEPFRSYAGISDIPGLELIHSEARSWFAHNRRNFDLIQMSMIDTWAATGAGAFALSENGLYTSDAWRVFMEDLGDDGVLTVSRWYNSEITSEAERMIALAVRTLFDLGAARPRDHIFVANAADVATLVLSKSPLTPERQQALRGQAQERGFDVIISPDAPPPDGMFARILEVSNAAALDRLAAGHEFDISPPTDDRPFFFNQVRIGNPLHVIDLVLSNSGQAAAGHARATLNLYLILVFALAMVVFTILRPLARTTAGVARGYLAAGTAWFLLIGLGFMLIEVALLQRMSVFLGHPVYSLSVVLFSLVLATGAGSLLSERLPLATPGRRACWLVATAALAVVLSTGLAPVFAVFGEASLPVRAAVCVAATLPLGILLGFGFPTGMALARAVDDRPSAWFWGINGAAGVMGSALAVALNIALGLTSTMLIGGLCYLLLAVPSWAMARQVREQS